MMTLLRLAAVLMVLAGGAFAAEYKAGALEIAQPWSRATPKGAKVASGYLTIRNAGSTPDRLIGATFTLSGGSEIHEMSTEGGVMKMRAIEGGIELAPGATVELKPGGYHLMFTGLTKPLAKGDRVKGTLVFQQAGTVDVEYAVEAIGGPPAGKSSGHGH